MVLMPVGEDDPDQAAHPLLDEFEIGQDQVDSGISESAKVSPRSAISHLPRQP